MKKQTKAAKGITFGDVSNQSIRNILSELSKKLCAPLTDDYFEAQRKFFDNKCPYTGLDMDLLEANNQVATDHIVPQNRAYCGLNACGNMLLCSKEANSKKGSKTAEEFLKADNKFFKALGTDQKTLDERLKKIQEYQKLYSYDGEVIAKTISALLDNYYNEVRGRQVAKIDELTTLLTNKTNMSVQKFIPDVTRKVGSIVRSEFFDLLQNGRVPKDEIAKLEGLQYSNDTFNGLNFPVLSKNFIDASGARTYAKPIVIFGEEYYVTNNWHEKNKDKLVDYINRYY